MTREEDKYWAQHKIRMDEMTDTDRYASGVADMRYEEESVSARPETPFEILGQLDAVVQQIDGLQDRKRKLIEMYQEQMKSADHKYQSIIAQDSMVRAENPKSDVRW